MDLHSEALKFRSISISYREAVAREDTAQAQHYMKQAKQLVLFNAQRITRAFRPKLVTKASELDRGSGAPLVALSMRQIISKGNALRRSDLVTLNTRKEKQLHGLNIMLDYSGSMWFTHEQSISGLQRIFAQNFLALVAGVYLQCISKGSMKVVYTPFSMSPCHVRMDDIMGADWDVFLVHDSWGSGAVSRTDLVPQALKQLPDFDRNWSSSEYPKLAIDGAAAYFSSEKLTDYITIMFTDGGMHRIGERREDRLKFIRQAFTTIAKDRLTFCYLISEQTRSFKEILVETGIKHTVTNTKEQYDDGFIYLAHLINQARRHK